MLARRLETLHTSSASGIRAELLDACREATGASIAVFLRPTPDREGVTRYRQFTVVGDAAARELMSSFEGAPMQEGSVVDTGQRVMSARRGSWSLWNPSRRHTNRFCLLAEDMSLERMKQTASYQQVYGPLDIIDQARMLVLDRDRVVAWFGVMNFAADGPVTPDRLALMNLAAPKVVAALRHAEALDRWDAGAGYALLLPSGRLDGATPNVAAWLTMEDRAHLGSLVRAFDGAGGAPRDIALRGATVEFQRLDADGQVRYLAVFSEAVNLVSPLACLSERRRETAELAALGLTVHEMADHMGVSTNTVRTQLRHVYDALGVTNRAELARYVEGALRSGLPPRR